MRTALRWLKDPCAVLDEARARHGPSFWLDLGPAGKAWVTGEPRHIAEIAGNPSLDAGRGIAALRRVMGDRSLITLDGPDHAARRRIVAPLFGREVERLDEMTVRVAEEEIARLRSGDEVAVYDLARRISLRVIVRLLFGDAPEGEAERAERLIDSFLLSFSNPLVLFLRPLQIDLGPFSPWGRARRIRERLHGFLRERIAACRARAGTGDSGLDRIVRGGTELADEEIATEALALLLFGHDTGAAALAWAIVHLYRHPEALARVRAEDETNPRPEARPFLRACLDESLRLTPVVVHLTRVARETIRLGDHELPEGTRIFPSPYLAQRDPEVFAEPEAFRPERFLSGRDYAGSYFPFGFTPRTCIGRNFALRQMLLLAATIVRRAGLGLVPGYEPRPERRLVLILPRGGGPMVVERLREAA